jgi:pyrroline-5-carboxylate reductase
VVEIDPQARGALAGQFDVSVVAGIPQPLGAQDVVVLAVKPQHMLQVARDLRPRLGAQLVVTIAAGIRTRDLSRWLGGYDRIVRVMPNTPALVRAGVSALYATPAVDAAARAHADSILSAVGATIWVEREELMDAVTAVSGSGPAYVFYFIEALVRAAAELGLTAEQSRRLAVQTFVGAAHQAAESSEPLATLRARVTSKGGTTAAALAWLESNAVEARIVEAVHAAHRRAGELGDEFGRQ